jgi:hypothetical protein
MTLAVNGVEPVVVAGFALRRNGTDFAAITTSSCQ